MELMITAERLFARYQDSPTKRMNSKAMFNAGGNNSLYMHAIVLRRENCKFYGGKFCDKLANWLR